jgi:hypothetical protein
MGRVGDGQGKDASSWSPSALVRGSLTAAVGPNI